MLPRHFISALFCAIFACVLPGAAWAVTHAFSVQDVMTFLDESKTSGERISMLIGQQVEDKLAQEGVTLTEGGLTYRTTNTEDDRGGCSKRKTLRTTTTLVLSQQTEFKVILDALSEPIIAGIDLVGTVDVDGELKFKRGARILGKCVHYFYSETDVSFTADVALSVFMVLRLNPTLEVLGNGDVRIHIAPTVNMGSKVKYVKNVNVDIDSITFLGPAFIVYGFLWDPIGDLLSVHGNNGGGVSYLDGELQDFVADKQAEMEAKLATVPTSFDIPASNAAVLSELLKLVPTFPTRFPVSYAFLIQHKYDILFALLVGDQESLKLLAGTTAACQLLSSSAESMLTTGQPSGFVATSWVDYCNDLVGTYLGDADAWDGSTAPLLNELPWTLYPTTTLDLGMVDIAPNYQPYMKRVKYKTVSVTSGTGQYCYYAYYWSGCVPVAVPRGNGTCKLEMRVYKKDVAANGLKPLLMLHGGSWKYRGAAFIAMETQISHYTERGFVVFAPFYRLIGETDGNVECNGATRADMLSDVNDALTWVENNMGQYGAGGQVAVAGQSAGAFLAAYLAVTQYTHISRALLFYAPSDLRDYIEQLQAGASVDEGGVDALALFFSDLLTVDQTVPDIDINHTTVTSNSFPTIVQNAPTLYPPMFMLHGRMDTLVPSRQSVRLCNALAGYAASGPASDDGGNPAVGGYRMVYKCDDRGSWLDVIAQSGHMLDVCSPADATCRTSKTGVEIAASLRDGYAWLNGNIPRTPGTHPNYSWLAPILTLLQ
jgi:acetyl esterase/lipase